MTPPACPCCCRMVPLCVVFVLQPRERGAAADADLAVIEEMRDKIISGEPFTERKSTFQVRRSHIMHPSP